MTSLRLLSAAATTLFLAAYAQADTLTPAEAKPGGETPAFAVAKPDKPEQRPGTDRPVKTSALPVAYLRTVRDGKDVLIPRLPMSRLHPSKIVPNLCVLTYRISTESPECQAHFDQGLGYF